MAGGIITTGTHPKLLWPGVYTTWGQVYAEHRTEYTDLYDIRDSDKAYETAVQVTGFGMAPIKPETQSVAYQGEVQGGITNYVHVPYGLGYIVSYEELRDNLYKEVAERRARANAFSMAQTIENVAAFLYNNAFSTTYFTTWDGAALVSASHLNATGGSFSNALTPAADLAESSIEDLGVQIMGAQNDTGQRIAVMMKSLHVAPSEWYNANRILKSVLQSNTTSNNINVLAATNALPEGIKVNHYFTSAHAWFVRTDVQEGMTFFWRDKIMFDQDNDFPTKNALAASYMRFSLGCTDPRGVYGSNGP